MADKGLRLPNVKKDQMAVDLIPKLKALLPTRSPPPQYLVVDSDVYEALTHALPRDGIEADHLNLLGWKVISRDMICELGDGK